MRNLALTTLLFTLALAGCTPAQAPPSEVVAPPAVKAPQPAPPVDLPPPLAYPARLAMSPEGIVCASDFAADAVVCSRVDAVGAPSPLDRLVLHGLDGPLGLALRDRQVLVGSQRRRSVEVFDATTGQHVASLGRGANEFATPNALAVAPDGSVYVADSLEDVVKVYGPGGALLQRIGGTGTAPGLFRFPSALLVTPSQLVVGDQGNHRLQVFDHGGRLLRTVGEAVPVNAASTADFRGRFTRIQGLARRGDEVLVLDSYHAHVQVFDADWVSQGFFGRPGDCPACLRLALDIAVSPTGTVLVADPEHQRLTRLPFAPR